MPLLLKLIFSSCGLCYNIPAYWGIQYDVQMLLEKYLNASEKHFNTIWIFLSTFICKKLIWWPHRTNTVAGRRAEIYFINTDWRTILPVCPFFKLSVMSDGIYPHALNHRWNSIAYTKYRSILFFIGEEEKGLQKWKKCEIQKSVLTSDVHFLIV